MPLGAQMPNQSNPAEPVTTDATTPEQLLRVKQVAAMLDLNTSTVYRLIEAGRLRALRLGVGNGGLRIPRDAYLEFVKQSLTATADLLSDQQTEI